MPGFTAPPPSRLLDVTGDGKAEVVIGAGSSAAQSRRVTVLRGTSTGADLAHPAYISAADLGLQPVAGDAFGSDFGR